ncbi:MAG: speG [Alphaproteobacteria bacterium]|jgi:RimJ/RimL family protein N-acetyltransferase|nr:speG [Alphaproteobacteria bacterium]
MTKIVSLRQAVQSDSHFLFGMKNDFTLQELLMCHPRNYSLEEIQDWIFRYTASKDSFLLVACNECGDSIGYLSIQRFLSYNRTAYFGIAIHPSYQGCGYGISLLNTLFEWSKKTLKIRKLLLEVSMANQKAINLYKKVGFSTVGTLKQNFFIRDSYQDVLLMEKEIEPT